MSDAAVRFDEMADYPAAILGSVITGISRVNSGVQERNPSLEPIWGQGRHQSTPGPTSVRKPAGGRLFAYFHPLDEFREELTAAGFTDITLVAVEGFGHLLSDLDQRLAEPSKLLQALRLTETEPSMLGVSAHVIGWARKP